jgi:hypothetical protein
LGGEKLKEDTMQEKKNPLILNAGQMSLILNISEETVKKLAKDKEIPCTYVNRRPQFEWNVILRYFKELEGGAA